MTIDLESRKPAPRLDNQQPGLFGQTPSQTVGPFFHYGLPWRGGADLVGCSDMGARPDLFPREHYVLALPSSTGIPNGEVIEIGGRVIDGKGDPLPDAMIEIWQANAAGRYRSDNDPRTDIGIDPHFVGFGRSSTSIKGEYRFRTIMPGRVPGPDDSLQAPHLALSVFGRGLIKRLATRIYFEGAVGNDTDPILALVPRARRHTMIAKRRDDHWWLDIVLCGTRETVFFDI